MAREREEKEAAQRAEEARLQKEAAAAAARAERRQRQAAQTWCAFAWEAGACETVVKGRVNARSCAAFILALLNAWIFCLE